MGSLRTLAVLSVVAAAAELCATIGRVDGLPSQRSLQLAAYHTHSYLRAPGCCTLPLENQTTTQAMTWSSSNDTKPRRHSVWSTDDMHVRRRKRSLLRITDVSETGTTDRNSGHPSGKTADVLSLSHLMTAMAHQLPDCELVLAYDDHYNDPRVLAGVVALPNVKQVSERRRISHVTL